MMKKRSFVVQRASLIVLLCCLLVWPVLAWVAAEGLIVHAPQAERADAIVVASINDLTERHGFGPMAVSRPLNFQSFSLQDDAGGLWVAEDADEILGFAWSWACGSCR